MISLAEFRRIMLNFNDHSAVTNEHVASVKLLCIASFMMDVNPSSIMIGIFNRRQVGPVAPDSPKTVEQKLLDVDVPKGYERITLIYYVINKVTEDKTYFTFLPGDPEENVELIQIYKSLTELDDLVVTIPEMGINLTGCKITDSVQCRGLGSYTTRCGPKFGLTVVENDHIIVFMKKQQQTVLDTDVR
jgi:hypothetical protein